MCVSVRHVRHTTYLELLPPHAARTNVGVIDSLHIDKNLSLRVDVRLEKVLRSLVLKRD